MAHVRESLAFVVVTLCVIGLALHVDWSFVANEAAVPSAALGTLALWRYGWWATHVLRSWRYHTVYRQEARQRAAMPLQPIQPKIVVSLYNEERPILERLMQSLVQNARNAACRIDVVFATYDAKSEALVCSVAEKTPGADLLEMMIVRQPRPGKRAALGAAIRALTRQGLGANDVVILMDGDCWLEADALAKTLRYFRAHPDIGAVTTNEVVHVNGPKWVQNLLDMRFAQRRLVMGSYALSKRVLILTGRMSAFRGRAIRSEALVRKLEVDYVDHWLWGRFRFLSGDDKSTWFALLEAGERMSYLPDVVVYTQEYVEGWGFTRVWENYKRWSGNMLRAGLNALQLGPSRMPFFIWWCLLDQRLAVWTMFIGFYIAIVGSLVFGFDYFVTYVLLVMITRLVFSSVLSIFHGKPRISFLPLLYLNQIIAAAVKMGASVFLARQKWAHRGGQSMYSAQISRGLVGVTVLFSLLSGLFFCVAFGLGYAEFPYFAVLF